MVGTMQDMKGDTMRMMAGITEDLPILVGTGEVEEVVVIAKAEEEETVEVVVREEIAEVEEGLVEGLDAG
jgi:hypothetical protein